MAGFSPFSPPGTLRTGGTQWYPGDLRDSVLSGPQVSWGLAGFSPLRPPGTLGTGWTQPFQPPRYLETGGTQSVQPPQVPWGFRPPEGLVLASH